MSLISSGGGGERGGNRTPCNADLMRTSPKQLFATRRQSLGRPTTLNQRNVKHYSYPMQTLIR